MNRRTPARVHTHAQAGTRWGRKALSLLLSLALCLSLLPTVAFAEGASGGSAEIQLGTGGIQTNDVVYYGVYTEDGTSYEVPWYALDTNGFLLSKYTIGTSIFRNRDDFGYYNYSTERECEDSSVLKKTMDGLYNGAGTTLFLDLEQGAIKKTTLTGESMHDSSTPGVQAHLFPLSLSEAWSIEKSQWEAQEITDPEGKGQGWWIRTSNVDNLANFMYSMYDSNTYIHVSKAVRPAFNLNLDAVLFTSAAVGGKNGTNIGLKKVDDNNGNEWKLTLKDSSRQFAVTETTASCKPGDTITLNYTGATIKTDDAPNEYISAMIADSSGVQYYGKIAQPTNEAGEIRITIPFSLTAGTYTLYVFSEQCNGDERTDYASDLKGIPLTVNNTPRPSDGDTPAIILGTSSLGTGDIVYFGTYGATDVPWYMLNNYGFMLSKYTLGTSDFRGNSSYYGPQAANGYYNYSTSSNEVISSVLKKTMDGLYNGTDTTLFSDLEQGAIKETTLTKESMYADDDRVTDVNAHLFPLSKAEAEVLDSEVRQARSIADPKGEARWWLRSSYSEGSAYFVSAGGGIDHVPLAIIALGVRPAFNLDMNSVLFASAAVDGKADTTVDGNLTEVSAYSDPEWKLTLRDSSRNEFTSSTTARSGNTLTVRYENAATGNNEYISAIVRDANGNVSYYGRIAPLDGTTNGANGTVSITLPDSFDKNTDTLYVFNEQYNGDKMTDYSSDFCTVDSSAPVTTCDVAINETNFPDAIFREQYVRGYDTDGNGWLSAEEIAAVTAIKCNEKGIESLKGIEYFTALWELWCSYNKLTSLDVSGNTALTYLNCWHNQLTELKFGTALTNLVCSSNQLTVLDVSSNKELTELDCAYNQLATLDVSENTKLEELRCNENRLTELKLGTALTNLTKLYCGENQLTALDVSSCTNLKWLYCFNNQLRSLIVGEKNSLTDLSCQQNQLTSLDLSGCPSLDWLDAEGNVYEITLTADGTFDLSTLPGFDVSKASSWQGGTAVGNTLKADSDAVLVTYAYAYAEGKTVTFNLLLNIEGTEIDIDAAHFPDEEFRTYILTNTDANIDRNRNGKLSGGEIALTKELDVYGRGIQDLTGIEYFTALEELDCAGNYLTELDVSKLTSLKELDCYSNNLTTLNVSGLTALTHLDCSSNNLTSLDVSGNTALTYLNCANNHLSSLDVSGNTALRTLTASGNIYAITLAADRTFDLSTLPGFDVSKADGWQGGTVSGKTLTVNSDADKVTYTYDCGFGNPVTFTLLVARNYTITFDANGGSVSPASAKTDGYGELSSLPTPIRSGHTFNDWYTEATGGDMVIVETVYTADTTIYAHWTKDDTPPVAAAVYTITFDANGGSVSPASAGTDESGSGKLSSLPTPIRSGYTFDGWYTAATGGEKVTADTVYTEDTTLYAHWTEDAPAPAAGYTITFDANGGTLSTGSNSATETEADGTVDYLARAARDGYTFDGWYTAAGEKVYTYVNVFTADTTVYAHWTPEAETKQITEASFALKGYTVGANAKDIVVTSNTEGLSLTAGYFEGLGKPYSYLLCEVVGEGPDDVVLVTGPLEAGKTYMLGLKADVNAGYDVGSGVTENTVTLNGTITADDCSVLKEESTLGISFVLPVLTDGDTAPAKYTVTVNGSYASAAGTGEYEEGDLVTLAAGSRSGYTFSGWTSDDVIIPNAGSADTSFVMPAKAVTVTANWTYNGGNSSGGSGSGSGSSGSGSGSSSGSGSTGTDETPDGWVEEDGIWHYYDPEDGTMVKDQWVLAKGVWYYLGSDGVMLTNQWVLSKGVWYFLGSDGAMVSNQWVLAKGVWYFLGPDGAMLTDQWVNWNGTWYYLDKNGAMLTSKWLYWKGAWYYLGESGAMLTGTVTPDGYRVDENGVWIA